MAMNDCVRMEKGLVFSRPLVIAQAIALSLFVYYRVSFLFQHPVNSNIHWLLVSISEFLLCIAWFFHKGYVWRPVRRNAYPELLPPDDQLPGLDVFIFTADPRREPTIHVMNTVLSAMALDYPADKLHVYLSDDAGAPLTLFGIQEAWKFARSWWLPFCKKYSIKSISPEAFFFRDEEHENGLGNLSSEFSDESETVKRKYETLKNTIETERKMTLEMDDITGWCENHPPVVQIINESFDEDKEDKVTQTPVLVYVRREKRPSRHHHFKAGAINVLLRVSSIISNSPHILMLDCDMNCNDPLSARKAMCFLLDPKISSDLAFVQYPQMFRGIPKNDIYNSDLKEAIQIYLYGIDGVQGPFLQGTNFFIKRVSLFGTPLSVVEREHKSIVLLETPKSEAQRLLMNECQTVATCEYEDGTKWGAEIGFRYFSVVEDAFTSFTSVHCNGWRSVYYNPTRPAFLGTPSTNLNDVMIQNLRWQSGLLEFGISRYCPLAYGPSRNLNFVACLCYAFMTLAPLLYSVSVWCLGTIPQLCVILGISLYPEVSSLFFAVGIFIFISTAVVSIVMIVEIGGSVSSAVAIERMWMMKSVTCNTYATLDVFLKKLNLRKQTFIATDKAPNYDKTSMYLKEQYDFRASSWFVAPIVIVVFLNFLSFVVGIVRMSVSGEDFVAATFLSLYVIVVGYPVVEGVFLRKDQGRIPPRTAWISAMIVGAFLLVGMLMH